MNMQRELGVTPDGKIGPQTRNAMARKPQIAAKYADELGGAKQYTGAPKVTGGQKVPATVPGGQTAPRQGGQGSFLNPTGIGKPGPTQAAAQGIDPSNPLNQAGQGVPPRPSGGYFDQGTRAWDQKYAATHNPNGTPKATSESMSQDDRILNMIRSIKF